MLSFGPVGFFESRMWMVEGHVATSTQVPPSVPLWLDLCQGTAISRHAPPSVPL